jgi:alpha-L-rhamnosidase
MSNNTQWIWIDQSEKNQPNQYVEFRREIELSSAPKNASLRTSVDTNFATWVNTQFAGCGQFGDFPDQRTFSQIDVTSLLKAGKNVLAMLVHYCGEDNFAYIPGDAGLWYELEVDGKVIATSNEKTLCRKSPCYQQKDTVRLTPQLGFTFNYDASQEDNTWQNAVNTTQDASPGPRPLKMLDLRPHTASEIIAQGLLKRTPDPGQTIAEQMQLDFLSTRRSWDLFENFEPNSTPAAFPVKLSDTKLEDSDGAYIVIDLGREEVGFIELETNCTDGCIIDIAIGEHLDDLRVRSSIGGRNFASRYTARKGHQKFTHYLHRYAGRYMQLHITRLKGTIELSYAGFIPSEYPVSASGEFNNTDSLCNQIWQTSRRTLHLCMHEHYEDCPWREQALYANDSRNQMLSGYYVFEDYDFARVSLDLLARTTGEDGYQELCSPMKHDFLIPSFTMTWFLAMNDYLMHSGDVAFITRMFPQIKQMLQSYIGTFKDGLLPCPSGNHYWQFYDWAPGMECIAQDDCTKIVTINGVRFDAPLNFLFIIVLQATANMAKFIGEEQYAEQCLKQSGQLKSATHNTFWDPNKKAYQSYVGDQSFAHYAELVQSFAILAGVGTEAIHHDLREKLVDEQNDMTTTTLSQSLYKFEAILLDETRGQFVFDKIIKDWSKMLYSGATSFWETLKAGWDFNHAGSLCHGWSGIPVYFYGAYGLGIKPLEPGFKSLALKPILPMAGLKGTIPTASGNIKIALDKAKDGYIANIQTPKSTNVVVDKTLVTKCTTT